MKVAVTLGGQTMMVSPAMARTIAMKQRIKAQRWARFTTGDNTVARLATGPSFSGSIYAWQASPVPQTRVNTWA